MSFNSLINKPALERDLLSQVVTELQSHYSENQNFCFFLKLAKSGDTASEIIWEKVFKSVFDLGDFYYETVMQRACLVIKFHEGRYEILCEGHFLFTRLQVWPDRTSSRYSSEGPGDHELIRMIPRELAERGFSEISEALSLSKGKKAI